MSRCQPNESHAVAVLGVHVGLNLEHEAGHRALVRGNLSLGTVLGLRRRAIGADALHQLLHAKTVDCAAEPDGRHVPLQERPMVEGRQQLAGHLDLLAQLGQQVGGNVIGQPRIVQPLHRDRLRHLVAVGPVHQLQPVAQHVIAADELSPHADRPGCRCHVDGQVFLDLVDDLERVAGFAVHLVAEGQDRQIAQAADLEQLAGLRFDTLGPVDDHDRRIHRGQRPIGIFGKVAVARRIHQVEAMSVKIERHRRRGHRDAAILFHLHEI